MTIEQIEELLKLKKENPDLEIVYVIDNEVFLDDCYKYSVAEFERIEKGIFVEYAGSIYINKEELENDIVEDIWDIDGYTEEENNKKVEEKMKEIKMKEAIIIYLGV